MKRQLMSDIQTATTVFEGWRITPEGGAVLPDEQVAVIADVHLGYEWARGAAGDCVPAHSLAETTRKLERLLERWPIDRLVVAGDLVESPRPCARTAADLAQLTRWLNDRGVRLVLIEGNHDHSLAWKASANGYGVVAEPPVFQSQLVVAGWTIVHGHRPTAEKRLISGHHHPVLRVSGHTAPCFLVGEGRIILPAFSANAAGIDVATARLPTSWKQSSLRCLASTGGDLLDFGPVNTLRVRLG
jgi:putative SbcD/Mre11-related phosphoesterase